MPMAPLRYGRFFLWVNLFKCMHIIFGTLYSSNFFVMSLCSLHTLQYHWSSPPRVSSYSYSLKHLAIVILSVSSSELSSEVFSSFIISDWHLNSLKWITVFRVERITQKIRWSLFAIIARTWARETFLAFSGDSLTSVPSTVSSHQSSWRAWRLPQISHFSSFPDLLRGKFLSDICISMVSFRP